MSITFDSDAKREFSIKEESCMCAQMAESFSNFYNGEDSLEIRQDLKNNANPKCYTCHGSGVEKVEQDNAPTMNLSNDNAILFFSILGIKFDYYGELSLPEARRGLIKALNRDSSKFTRKEEKTFGKPRETSPGVYDLKPIKLFDQGVDEDRIADYLKRFGEFLHKVAKIGATKIIWS